MPAFVLRCFLASCVLCAFGNGSALASGESRRDAHLRVGDSGICNFTSSWGPFGLPRTVEVLPQNVEFESGNVLVVRNEDLRFLLFARNNSQGQPTCEEQARVLCSTVPSVARGFLEVGRGACGSRPVCNAGPPQLSYARSMIGGVLSFGQTQLSRVAVLGLGAGSLPLWFAQQLQGVKVDAVDVDADVLAAAPCFGLVSPQLSLVHSDGRRYLQGMRKASLDALVVDVFDSEDIPPCLRTVEFFELAFEKLAPGGVLVMNVWRQHVSSVRQAMAAAFPGQHVFVGGAPGLGNLLLLVAAPGGGARRDEDVGGSAQWARDAKFSEQAGDFARQLRETAPRDKIAGAASEPLRDSSACPSH